MAGRVAGGRQAQGDSHRETSQNNHSFYVQDNFQVSRRLTLNYGPALGLLRRDRRVAGPLHALRPGERDRGAASRSSTTRTGTTSPARERGLGPLGRRHDRAARRLGALLRRLLAGLLRGPDPLGHVQPRRGLQRGRRLQLLAGRGAGAGRAGLLRLQRLRRVDGGPRAAHALRPELQRQRAAAARRRTPRCSSATWARRDASCSASAPSTRPTPRPASVPTPTTSTSTSSSRAPAPATTRCRRACGSRDWKGLTSTLNYNWSHSIDTASDGQDYVPHAAQPDDSLEPGRERADSNFDARHRLVWYFTWEIGDSKRPRAALGLVAERHRHAGQRDALQRRLPLRGRLQRQRAVLRPARPRRRPLRGHGRARPLPEPRGLPGALHPERRGRLRRAASTSATSAATPSTARATATWTCRSSRTRRSARGCGSSSGWTSSTSSTTRTSRTRCCRTTPWTSSRTASIPPPTAGRASCRSRPPSTWAGATPSWAAEVRGRSSSPRGVVLESRDFLVGL